VKGESALGVRLPEALREYYRVAGRLDEVNRSHHRLRTLDGLEIVGDYLMFMEENQDVLFWGIRVSDLSHSDPDVWQTVMRHLMSGNHARCHSLTF
jgi:hypothetical protein